MKPNKNIIKQIENNNFNLSFHPVFNLNPSRLMGIGFKKSLELVKRRVGDYNLSPSYLFNLYQTYKFKIQIIEDNIKSELEQIAEDTIREMYDVPEEINIKPKIVNQDDIEYDFENQNEKIEVSPERMILIKEEANKRIILNSIVHGSSVMIWSSAYYIAKEKLDELNNKLIELYDIYSAVVGHLLWLKEPSQNLSTAEKQGVCEIDFEEGLSCEGINFPTLLLETNKVVLDYLICKGIPSDFNEEELKLYYSIADDYNFEVWNSTLSPVLYLDFLETIEIESNKLPEVISKLSQLNYEELKNLFISIQQDSKELGKMKLNQFKIV
ncbi:MAG TPA: hypothetical protein EYG86_01435 [Crocinitomicaceae bacterium]|nr:hypothetical protein [Crocinitomicaceae bacterium]